MTPFRNVELDPASDPDTWPFEAVATVVTRGGLTDWRRLVATIDRSPWGPCARAVATVTSWGENDGVDVLLGEAVTRARTRVDAEARARFGARLRAARLAAGLSQRDLAPLIGTSAQRLSAYETGRTAPSVHILGRIERVLGVPG